MGNAIFKLLAKLYAAWVHRLERKIGYSLVFSNIPNTWINGWMIYDMTRAWAKHGINATGVNYFTVGNLVNNLSSRFIRDQKQYQSWLGVYLVKFEESKDFALQDCLDLAVADQKNWLKSFGDTKPFIEMSKNNIGKVEPITIGFYQGKLYEFLGGQSHSDVGKRSINWKAKFNMAVMAAVMNLSNKKLSLQGSNFLPKDVDTNYEMVTLKGYVAIIELEKNVKLVLYGNGTAIRDQQGKEVNCNPELMANILRTFKEVVINKSG